MPATPGIERIPKQPLQFEVGFTLIELLLVILIIGIVSVTVMPKWPGSTLNLEAEARKVLHDIRYAQTLSMLSGQRYRWVRTSTTTYQITTESGAAIVLSTGGTTMTLANNASFGSLTNLPNNLIAFDSQGAPYTTSGFPGTALASAAVIPITGGGLTRSVQITPQTGYGNLQ